MVYRILSLSLMSLVVAVSAGAAVAAEKPAEKGKMETGTVVSVAKDKLVMKNTTGKEESVAVGETTKVMINGKAGKLADLVKGERVTVHFDSAGKCTQIDAKTAASRTPAANPKN